MGQDAEGMEDRNVAILQRVYLHLLCDIEDLNRVIDEPSNRHTAAVRPPLHHARISGRYVELRYQAESSVRLYGWHGRIGRQHSERARVGNLFLVSPHAYPAAAADCNKPAVRAHRERRERV